MLTSTMKSGLLAAVLALASFAASAQQAPTVRIRGTIESVDGNMLGIKTREGSDVKVRMTDNVAVFAVVKTELSEIKEGSYIGVTGMPEPDGTQKAIAVHIFPENQRGAAEGFRPWDARANSTMTNATVAQTVKGTDGQNITVKYKDGEKKVVAPPDNANRHLHRHGQVGSEAGRQADHLRRGEEGRRLAGGQPRQCRARWSYATDVRLESPMHSRCHPGQA
ncbi:hypothetical protein ABIA00_003614 [Bradyrhizobium ottawaense]